ncbi:MAG: holo-ACP synthase [Acutalibacteraceae bacterium]|jgi:holo-[acyl-carrier protein] synthase|nr:holo-ACP synthase [Clostridiales bacterium]
MLVTTGVDLVEISRIKKSMAKKGFIERVFGPSERVYLGRKGMPVQSVAAAFCAKEAFGKALGCGISGFGMREVEVMHDEQGRPYFKLSGRAKQLADIRNLSFEVSLTHTKSYAMAVVVAYKS